MKLDPNALLQVGGAQLTVLCYAVMLNSTPAVRVLLDAGADPHKTLPATEQVGESNSPFEYAFNRVATGGSPEMAQLFLQSDARLRLGEGHADRAAAHTAFGRYLVTMLSQKGLKCPEVGIKLLLDAGPRSRIPHPSHRPNATAWR